MADNAGGSDRKAPGFWFFPDDYEQDMQLLPLAAQGLWMRMLCWMHRNEAHRGFLELPTGEPMLDSDIARKAGNNTKEIQRCLAAMERIGVFDRDDRGCILNRRMARDTHISQVRRDAAIKRAETVSRAKHGEFKSQAKDFHKTPTERVVLPNENEDLQTTEDCQLGVTNQESLLESPKQADFAPPKSPAKVGKSPTVPDPVPVPVLLTQIHAQTSALVALNLDQQTDPIFRAPGGAPVIKLAAVPPRNRSGLHPEWFEEWWAIYWRKVSRKAAEKAFLAKVKTEARFAVVIAATKAQTPAMMAKEPDFRPHGATWLNGERWNDQASVPATADRQQAKKESRTEMLDRIIGS